MKLPHIFTTQFNRQFGDDFSAHVKKLYVHIKSFSAQTIPQQQA